MKKDVNVSLVQGGKLTKGGWLSIVSFLLVAVIALSVALGLVVKSHKEETSAEEVYAGGGMVLPEEAEENGISLVSMEIPKEQYEDYGIMPIAETSYSVTATAKAQGGVALYEVQQKFNWSLAWASSNAADVNTYVSLSASSGDRTATVSLLQPFSTQILLKCTWLYNDTQSSSLTLDYAKRFKGFRIQYASSFAKSAKDEDHLSTFLVEPGTPEDIESGSDVYNLEMHLVEPILVTGEQEWRNSSWNAVVFRVVEPVFDDVGTLENSIVSLSDDPYYHPEAESTFDHISDQMTFYYAPMDFDASLSPVSGDVTSEQERGDIPQQVRSFTQYNFLRCGFKETSSLTSIFGKTGEPLTDFALCYSTLSLLCDYDDSGHSLYAYEVYFPSVVNFQYGGDIGFYRRLGFSFEVDLLKNVSIDFTKSNFIF